MWVVRLPGCREPTVVNRSAASLVARVGTAVWSVGHQMVRSNGGSNTLA